jgi:opacity protein-like surface antigen
MIKQAVVAVVALLSLTSFGFGQEEGRWDVTLNLAGLIAKQTSGNGTTQIPTSGIGFLGTGRFRFAKKSSLEANWGRSNDSENYITSSLQYRIPTTTNEFSGAYVFTPMETKRFKPFLLVGGGVLVFNPNNTLIGGNPQSLEGVRQIRPAVLYGGGVDYHLTSFLALRLQYRGLFYSPPDFQLPGLFTGGRGHTAEPAIGVVVRF